MSSRLPSLHDRVRTFRQQGEVDGTFGSNLSDVDGDLHPLDTSGADGLASAVWITSDGHPVLNPEPWVGGRLRRKQLSSLRSDQLPDSVVPLTDLLALLDADAGPECVLLDVAGHDDFSVVQDCLSGATAEHESRVWLRHEDPDVLQLWRTRTGARLVNSLSSARTAKGLERRVAKLHELGVDAVSAHHKELTGGSVALAHRFGLMAIAVGATHERELAKVVDAGIDGLVSGQVDRMTAVVAQYYPPVSPPPVDPSGGGT